MKIKMIYELILKDSNWMINCEFESEESCRSFEIALAESGITFEVITKRLIDG